MRPKMNKKRSFILIGILWVVILGGFVAFQEFTLRTGNEILLKIIPVDPRDLFRGDYVILSYEISVLNTDALSYQGSSFKVGDNVYVLLNVDANKIGSLADIEKKRPDNGLFIKGVVKGAETNRLRVEYGIESYFVSEGKGKKTEKMRWKIHTKVAVDRFGNAAIKSLVVDEKDIEDVIRLSETGL